MRNEEVRTKDAEIATRLRSTLAGKRIEKRFLAEQLGISTYTFSNKINGETGFTVGEFVKVAIAAKLTVSDVYDILGI